MVKLKSWKIFAILFEIFLGISASTHWVVTENGRIQSQLDSAFHLRRPYDLLALLEQEQRVHAIEELYRELVARKAAIDHQWSGLEGATDLEARLFSQDIDCVRAGGPLTDSDLYLSLAGDIKERIRLDHYLVHDSGGKPSLPDCTEAVELDFSMHSFEHLEAMVWRTNLSSGSELALVSSVLEERDIATFAQQVASGLQRNSSSWLHHNLAAIYWRIRGDAPSAAECARRAIHFAPRHHRDLALLTLGGLLLHARVPAEAALVLHAAVDHAPSTAHNHLALGAAYALLADYNRSVACLDNALKLQPGLDAAVHTRHLVLCHRKLEIGLLGLHQSLQGILAELHEYHVRQEHWLRQQEQLLWQQVPLEIRLLGQEQHSLADMLRSTGQSCVHQVQDGRAVLKCLNSENQLFAHNLQVDITLSLQMLLKNVESQAKKISEQMARRGHMGQEQPRPNTSTRYSQPVSAPSPNFTPPPTDERWPSQEECIAFADKFPFWKDLPSAFLPAENKGFEVDQYLSRLIGLAPGQEHALPWYPPVCTPSSDSRVEAFFPSASVRDAELLPEEHLRLQLVKYGTGGQSVEAEIGQRILTAISKEAGPSWLLHTLAALYWRVRGNAHHAMDCLRTALIHVPEEFRDVVLVSLGALLHRMGHLEAAHHAANEALAASGAEVATHFLMATVLMSRGNHSGTVHHLRQVLAMEPSFLDGGAHGLLRAAACWDKFGSPDPADATDTNTQEMCGAANTKHMDLLSTLEGLREGATVLCSPDGEQCRAVQCFSAGHDTGGVVTLEPAAMSRLLASGSSKGTQCGDGSLGMDSNGDQTDETELERMAEQAPLPKQFHLRISLGDDSGLPSTPPLGDLFVPVALTDDAWLHVYDRSGTYPLSPAECERIRNVDWGQQTGLWLATAKTVMVDGELPPLPHDDQEMRPPQCDHTLPPSPLTLDHLAGVRLRHRLHCGAETALAGWLSIMAGDISSSTQELGMRLALALQENATSWVLATAAALYWRVVGRADQAVTCLRQALQYAPSPDKNIPLVSLASVLHRAGFYNDALVVANMALELAPKFEVAHFIVANIHASMGDLEKAIGFYRSSLALRPEFEPARNRLQSVLCSVLFDEHAMKPDL